MSSATVTRPPAPADPARAAPALLRLTQVELRLFLRERAAIFWGIGFPVVLLVIFGAIPGFRSPVSKALPGVSILDAYVPILFAFVLAMLALNVVPPVLAGYREKGILRRLATTPVGPGRILAAQLIVNISMAIVTLVVLLVLAKVAYHVPLPRQAAGFVLALALAIVALFGLGMVIAAVATTGRMANAAGAILFFPLMFFSGLWLPIASMPAVLQHVSHVTPLGAAVQALTDAWAGHLPHPVQLITLAVYAIVLPALAARSFRWE